MVCQYFSVILLVIVSYNFVGLSSEQGKGRIVCTNIIF